LKRQQGGKPIACGGQDRRVAVLGTFGIEDMGFSIEMMSRDSPEKYR
jgi:hypothetical protein